MRTKILCIILLIFFLISCNSLGLDNESSEPTSSMFSSDSKASEKSRHYEKEGGFSYVIPEGWELTDIHDLKYQGLIDSKSKNILISNIAISVEEHSGKLDAYVDASIKNLEIKFPDKTIIRKDKLVNDQGLTYYSVNMISNVHNTEIPQVTFIFSMGDTKLLLIYSTSKDEDIQNLLKVGDFINSIRIE